ncbi:FixH family protein [Jannaschia rubra]|uniref:Putative integral membrane protein linked to a cation pump n=1 Tax=Jannaschia rubra TaxID=282197 RepID=A0A0M6XWG2_9RHOB|nr:FixH family protein [Jannaschia rubra]CTQ34621.1 putative integral membrane protein linked to a cation pump [Jannaschia rubra]SFG71743.1 Nitrogen fixation protein FixH [Jannaschia rubra]
MTGTTTETSTTGRERRLTGWHVLAMFGGGFAVIIGVNLALAFNAIRTFPGLETESSYVASQTFDADRAAQDALGWDMTAKVAGGQLVLTVAGPDGTPVHPDVVDAVLGRPTTVADDRTPAFAWDGTALRAPVDLGPGNWNLRLDLRAPDGTPFRRRIVLNHAP